MNYRGPCLPLETPPQNDGLLTVVNHHFVIAEDDEDEGEEEAE